MTIWGSRKKTCESASFFKFLQKVSEKCLTRAAFVRIIAHVDRLNAAKQNKILGICIVVVR